MEINCIHTNSRFTSLFNTQHMHLSVTVCFTHHGLLRSLHFHTLHHCSVWRMQLFRALIPLTSLLQPPAIRSSSWYVVKYLLHLCERGNGECACWVWPGLDYIFENLIFHWMHKTFTVNVPNIILNILSPFLENVWILKSSCRLLCSTRLELSAVSGTKQLGHF